MTIKMSSSNESYLLFVVKTAAFIFQVLPFKLAVAIGRAIGFVGYYLLPKKRRVVYANLRTVFTGHKSPQEIRRLSRRVFANFAQSFVELMCLPKIKRLGFSQFATVDGKEHLNQAIVQGKGIIFVAIHSGNWELGSMAGSLCDYPYNVIANAQPKAPLLDKLLNEYRKLAGAKVITPGIATREIIRVLKNNEILALVFDQGGAEGVPVKFLGKTASMSTGAVRLALKYGAPICPVWGIRLKDGHHRLRILPPMLFPAGNVSDKDISNAVQQAAEVFENLLLDYPDEYMWFYKVFKYSTQSNVLILDDGRTGHLRQSQSVAEILSKSLMARGKSVETKISAVVFKNPSVAKLFSLYSFLSQYLEFLRKEEALTLFLTKESYALLMAFKGDFIISCGSTGGGINYFMSQIYSAKSICILKPGLVSWDRFNLVIIPEHDKPTKPLKTRVALTKTALNLITPEYLTQQKEALLSHYSHLKGNVRTKIGVLLGGDTKGIVFDEAQIRLLIRQLKDAALHFNADIVLTTSRRTSKSIDALIAKEMKSFERCALCIIANENNISSAVGGILALSDVLIVSGESISMVSEAVCSGKKTIVFCPTGNYAQYPKGKYDRFVLNLNEERLLLAASIKDISTAISNVLRNRFVFKVPDDRAAVHHAIEGII